MPLNTPTPVIYDNKARAKVLSGINKIYDAVKMSMGPQGGNALLYGLYSRPYRITNDGFTIAEVIELKDPHEKLAVEAFKDAAKRTNREAGDGTSATTVIAGKLLNDIIPMISKISNTASFERGLQKSKGEKKGVMEIKKELSETCKTVIEKLKDKSTKIKTEEELKRIATISVEDEEKGEMISKMAWKVGTGGYIDVVEGIKEEIESEIIEGARFPAKVCGEVFVNNPSQYQMVTENAPVILTNYTVDKKIMETFMTKLEGLPKMIIIAPDFEEATLVIMAEINLKHKNLIYAPVKVPSLKTVQFEDVAVFTGARFLNKDQGDKCENITNADLGFLSRLVVKKADIREDCVALGGKGTEKRSLKGVTDKEMVVDQTPVEKRIKELKSQIENTREEGQKNLLRRRIAGLASSVGIIRVGCESEGETYYWKKKIEDAVYACKSALEEGYIRGGGLELKEIAEDLPEDNLLRAALIAPYEQIQENAGGDLEITKEIIDPTKAIRCAVEYAVSVSANLATVKVMIPHERERTPVEGNIAIAAALHKLAYWWAVEKGIIDENDREIQKDAMADHDAILRNTID